MKLEAGSRVQDYVLVERLGAGAFGEVWKAAHAHLPRIVAIKFATSDAAAAALLREGISQFGLDHPGIVSVLDANLSAAPPYVILEYIDGKSLRQVLRERGRLEIADVSSIFRQLAAAIAHAHERGVVHGDLKPENILVSNAAGPQLRVKITDFQLGAFSAGSGRPPRPGDGGVRPSLGTGVPVGTYRYLAPEQESGGEIDARADLYALGVVLFEMLTGTLPQGRDLPSDLEPSVSWWWDHIFSRCYTGRERRYRSADELLRDVAAAAQGPRWGEMPSQRAAHPEPETRSRKPEIRRVAGPEPPPLCVTPRAALSAAAVAVAIASLLIPLGVLASIGAFERLPALASAADPNWLGGCPEAEEREAAPGPAEILGRYVRAMAVRERVRPESCWRVDRAIEEIHDEAERRGFRIHHVVLGGRREVHLVRMDGEDERFRVVLDEDEVFERR